MITIKEQNFFIIIGQILIMVAAVLWCFTIVGAIWWIPMLIGCKNRLNCIKKIDILHIIIAIIFYGLIGGLLTLVGASHEKRL